MVEYVKAEELLSHWEKTHGPSRMAAARRLDVMKAEISASLAEKKDNDWLEAQKPLKYAIDGSDTLLVKYLHEWGITCGCLVELYARGQKVSVADLKPGNHHTITLKLWVPVPPLKVEDFQYPPEDAPVVEDGGDVSASSSSGDEEEEGGEEEEEEEEERPVKEEKKSKKRKVE
jgi:hypothetical protein